MGNLYNSAIESVLKGQDLDNSEMNDGNAQEEQN